MRDKILISPPPGVGVPHTRTLSELITDSLTIFFSIAALAVLAFFLWGAFQWVTSGGEKEKIAAARQKIMASLIGLALIGLAFFIARFVGETFGIDPTAPLNLPTLTGP